MTTAFFMKNKNFAYLNIPASLHNVIQYRDMSFLSKMGGQDLKFRNCRLVWSVQLSVGLWAACVFFPQKHSKDLAVMINDGLNTGVNLRSQSDFFILDQDST